MLVYESVRAGKFYPIEHVTQWGRTKQSDGYGPRPCCTALVPNPYAPKAPDGSTPLQVCGGELVARDVPDAEITTRGGLVNIEER